MDAVVISNLNKRHKINKRFVKGLVKKILHILKKPHIELEVVFLSDAAIRALNRKYKHRDAATDVLSFKLGEFGDIIISTDTALRNSRLFGTSFESEIVLYCIHGILHLLGYNDMTRGQRNRMSKKQSAILERLCGKEDFSKVLMPR